MSDPTVADMTADIRELERITRTGDLDAALVFCGEYWTKRKAGAPEPTLYNGDTFVLTVENRIKDKFEAEQNR